jgi:L-ascorbate metabolism protein UlaG (beta-lactamase superfamily)
VGTTLKGITGTHDYADGNWHHYMVTHDGVNLKLYVDGSLEGSVATGGSMDAGTANWEIGRAQDGSADLNTGRVDTVRFYNATLSLAQIKQNYVNGLAAHA